MLHTETITFSWDSPEFEFKEKRKDWYWILGIVAVLVIVAAVLLHNYLFGFLVLIAAFLMLRLSTHSPLDLSIEVSQHGIKIHNEMYPYESIKQFWISYNKDNQAILLLLTAQKITPMVSVVIDQRIDLMELRGYLGEFIAEEEMKESLADRIIHSIGF